MLYSIIALIVISVVSNSNAVLNTHIRAFEEWRKEHKHEFGDQSSDTYKKRLLTFIENSKRISDHAKTDSSYTLGLTSYAHLTSEEFKSTYLKHKIDPSECIPDPSASTKDDKIPSVVDWRKEEGTFTAVKSSSAACAYSSWALASVATIETYYALNGGDLTELSTQQVLDCAPLSGELGCDGGTHIQAFAYVQAVTGLESVDDYPSEPQSGKCKSNLKKSKVGVSSFIQLPKNGEANVTYVVATNGPVTVAMHGGDDLHLYKDGIYAPTNCSSKVEDANFFAVVVGYQEAKNGTQGYWIVRNSVGDKWGQNGYFLLKKGENTCGVSSCAAYPIVPVSPTVPPVGPKLMDLAASVKRQEEESHGKKHFNAMNRNSQLQRDTPTN